MSQAQPGYENFPAVGIEDLEGYLHETTGDEYIYYKDKHSWRVLNAAKNKIFTGPNSPDTPLLDGNIAGYVPVQGDLWWDTEHMELRVWHQPDPLDPMDQVPTPGRWISSTNPHMSPLAPDKNLVIGNLKIIEGATEILTNGVIYEDFQYDYEVTRTDSNAPESSIGYQWSVTPDKINGEPIVFSHPTSPKTRVQVPVLKRDPSGNPIVQSMRIFCTVFATKDVDKFLEPQKKIDSGILGIRPVPEVTEPITGNVEVIYKSEFDIFGVGSFDNNIKLFEITAPQLNFSNYDNTSDLYPPGASTYGKWEVDTSYTDETTVINFDYIKNSDFVSDPLQFFENPERTIPWGTTIDTGADFGQDPNEDRHTILVDKEFTGTIYFSKRPAGLEPGMAGHIVWGYLPPSQGEIGNVTITGDITPQKNVPTAYTVNYDGDLPNDVSDLSITYATTDPDATIDQDNGVINFVTVGVHEIKATVRSIFASDRVSNGTLSVTVQDGLDSIGDVEIRGSDTTTVGTPEVYNTYLTGDVQTYDIVYTTSDATATISGNSIIFGSVGSFEVTSTVIAANTVDSPVSDTMTVDVATGISSVVETHRDPAFTARSQTFTVTPSVPIPDATYTWKTTRSEGGTVWEAKPAEAITGGTSGRETGEELVDGNISGESYVRLNSTAMGPNGGLFITYPSPVTPNKVGVVVSCVDINGNTTDNQPVNVTLQTIPADGSAGSSFTSTINSGDPYEVTLNLNYVSQEILGMRVQTTTSGHKLAVHGFTIDGGVVQSYLNDEIINNGENADITMYRYDEQRTVQCVIDGVSGRSVGRLALDVIDPPDPSLGSTKFKKPTKICGPNTEYIYEFTNDANVPVAYEAIFDVTSGNLFGNTTEELENMYTIDYSEINDNKIGVKFNFMYENNHGSEFHDIHIVGDLTLIVTDARDDIDIDFDNGEERLSPRTAKVANISVDSPIGFANSNEYPSDVDFPANTDMDIGYLISHAPNTPFGYLLVDTITNDVMVATDENGNEFTGTTTASENNTYHATFNLPAGRYTFRNTVTFQVDTGETYTAKFHTTRTVA